MPNIRFLVVERNQRLCDLIRKVVTDADYGEIVQVSEVGEAVLKLGADDIHFVICDWPSPGGPETGLLKLIKFQRRYSHIPVLMTSTLLKGESSQAGQSEKASVDGYLLKPYTESVLKQAIDEILSRYPIL